MSRRARYFYTFNRVFDQFLTGLRAVHQGIWLGLLDREALHETTALYYSERSFYSDPGYNNAGLLAWESRVADRYFGDCQRLLVLAAGGGREVAALARLGKNVTGLECCDALVKAADELLAGEGIDAEVRSMSPDMLPEELATYDGLIIGWGAYSHIRGRAARIAFLMQCRDRLRPGGPMLASFLARNEDSRRFRWIYHIARAVNRLARQTELVEMGDYLDTSFDHYFNEAEIRDELCAAGFEVVEFRRYPFGHVVATNPRSVSN